VELLEARYAPQKSAHILQLCLRLEDLHDPIAVADLDIESFESFVGVMYVLRDRGGPLNQDAVQVIFYQIPKLQELIVVRVFQEWTRISSDDIAATGELFVDYVRRGRDCSWSTPVRHRLSPMKR